MSRLVFSNGKRSKKGNILPFLDEIKSKMSDGKPYPLTFGLRNPYRNLKSENSQDHAWKSQQNCTSMNSASVKHIIESNHALLKKYCKGDLKAFYVEHLPQI